MSSVAVADRRGGVFQVVVDFTYGECDRLPFNALRKIRARIEQVPHGGIRAVAEFNVRNPRDQQNMVETLALFGRDGAFQHGSPADPEVLKLEEPPADEDIPGLRTATAGRATAGLIGTRGSVPSPEKSLPVARGQYEEVVVEYAPGEEEPVVETEEDVEIDEQPPQS